MTNQSAILSKTAVTKKAFCGFEQKKVFFLFISMKCQINCFRSCCSKSNNQSANQNVFVFHKKHNKTFNNIQSSQELQKDSLNDTIKRLQKVFNVSHCTNRWITKIKTKLNKCTLPKSVQNGIFLVKTEISQLQLGQMRIFI